MQRIRAQNVNRKIEGHGKNLHVLARLVFGVVAHNI